MQYLDKQTGNKLSTKNPFTIEQYNKYPDRFEKIDGRKKANAGKPSDDNTENPDNSDEEKDGDDGE